MFGLIPLRKEWVSLDFSHSLFFGKSELPMGDFIVAEPITIRDQGRTDMCAAYAVTSTCEKSVALEPSYTFAKIKQLMGDAKGYGCDLRTACQVATTYGFLEDSKSPFSREKNGRDFVADWHNWNMLYDVSAKTNREKSYFRVDGHGDLFDSIRSVMWTRKKNILVDCYWQPDWFSVRDGVIKTYQGNKDCPHAFKIFGQKTINGELYLTAQLSQGIGVGDKGLFYFRRDIVNNFLNAYAFEDVNPEQVKGSWTILQKIKSFFL